MGEGEAKEKSDWGFESLPLSPIKVQIINSMCVISGTIERVLVGSVFKSL